MAQLSGVKRINPVAPPQSPENSTVSMQHFKAPRAILISKNGFAKGVYEFVEDKPIELWNMNRLIEMQKKLDQ